MVDADWYAFRQEEMYDPHREMSKALVVKKPQEAQKSKSLVGHESSQRQGRRSFMIPLAKRTFREEI